MLSYEVRGKAQGGQTNYPNHTAGKVKGREFVQLKIWGFTIHTFLQQSRESQMLEVFLQWLQPGIGTAKDLCGAFLDDFWVWREVREKVLSFGSLYLRQGSDDACLLRHFNLSEVHHKVNLQVGTIYDINHLFPIQPGLDGSETE